MTVIRKPAVSGSFYPAQRDALERQLTWFLSEASNAPHAGEAVPKAIIGPHAGYVYSGPVAARAYARLAAARGRISRVVLIGPSHHVAFRGLAVDASDAWETPCGTVALDTEAIARLHQLPMVGQLDAAHQREHALEVHVPFLQHVLGDFRLVPIVAGDAPADAVAALFDAVWGGGETLIVVSTDLSHYLDYAACRSLDARTADAIERFDDSAIGSAEACGQVPTRGLLRVARQRGMAIERLDLRNSGDTAGPRDRVVGYGAWALYEAPPSEAMPAGVEANRDAAAHEVDQRRSQRLDCRAFRIAGGHRPDRRAFLYRIGLRLFRIAGRHRHGGRRLIQRPGAIPHDPVPWPRRVAGIAQVQPLDRHPALPRHA